MTLARLLSPLLRLSLEATRANRETCVFIRTITVSSLHRASAGGKKVFNLFLAGR
jgi:hypothetical protein